jgi:hypothetical protein
MGLAAGEYQSRRPALPKRFAHLALAVTTALTAAALAGGTISPALAAPRAAPHPASGSGGAQPLLLLNGDRLVVPPGSAGARRMGLIRASRTDALEGLRFDGQTLEIPVDALPYLGRGLDPALFDLAALTRVERNGELPVRVSFGGAAPALPGLTVTSTGPGSEAGYFTAAAAARFGAALWRQYRADHATGRYGGGLFGGGVSIALAGPASQAAALTGRPSPRFPMHTLTVTATNEAGHADTGDTIFISSADSVSRFNGLNETINFFYHGSAKFSAPAGHYWALAIFTAFSGNNVALRFVVVPQFTIAGNHSALNIAERSASSQFVFRTPRPTPDAQGSFAVVRTSHAGGTYSFTNEWSGLSAYVNTTTRKPTVGRLNVYTSDVGLPTTSTSVPYVYNLDYPAPPGIIPPQTYNVSAASLGTVHERYYQDVPSVGGFATFGGTLAQLSGFDLVEVNPQKMPADQVQYFSASPKMIWQNNIWTNFNAFDGFVTNNFQSYASGATTTENWNNYPLHPAPDVAATGAAGPFVPTQVSAGRTGNSLNLVVTPFSDNQPGHLGAGFFNDGAALVQGRYAVAENGRKLASGNAVNGVPAVKLAAAKGTVKFTYSAARYSSFFQLSPSSQTTWTWRTAPDAAATVGRSWYCTESFSPTTGAIHFDRACAAQPMMTLNYAVSGLGLDGQTAPGRQVVDVTAGHIELGGHAAITGATAQVSLNDGESFRPATVTALGGGRFRLTFTAPAGTDVTLRVSATDAVGGSISETIERAYGVSQ